MLDADLTTELKEIELTLSPHDDRVFLEQQVLGIILLHGEEEEILEKTQSLTSEYFYRHEHQLIYRCISELIQAKQAITVLTVADILKSKGQLNEAKGELYLFDLARAVMTKHQLKPLVELLKKKFNKKRLANIGRQLMVDSLDDSDLAIETAKKALDNFDTLNSAELTFRRNNLAKLIQEIDNRREGQIKGLITGFRDLDQITHGFQESDLIVLAARPSIGKTTLAVNIADYVSFTGNKTVLFFSLEMNRMQILERSISNISNILSTNLQTGNLLADEYERLTRYLEKAQNDRMIIEDKSSLYVHEMRGMARTVQKQHGLGLVIIDHLGFIQGHGENETLKLGNITRELKSMARDLKVPVVLLCQLNRGVEQRNNKRPALSDLRQSGRIEEDADLVLMLYREEYYDASTPFKGIGELIITKHRNGAVGTVYLSFQGQYCRFLNFTGQLPSIQVPKERKRDYFDYS